jgi:hypothetical protein
MCVAHWRMVPKLLQRVVYGAWKRFQKRGTAEAAKDHRAALDDAIAAVTAKIEAKDVRRQKDQGNLLEE